jgi:hypothetical protein
MLPQVQGLTIPPKFHHQTEEIIQWWIGASFSGRWRRGSRSSGARPPNRREKLRASGFSALTIPQTLLRQADEVIQ